MEAAHSLTRGLGFRAIVRGVVARRPWQGALALTISAACIGWIVYSIWAQPFNH